MKQKNKKRKVGITKVEGKVSENGISQWLVDTYEAVSAPIV